VRSTEGRSGWTLRVRDRRERRWRIQASLAALERPFRPCAVSGRGGHLTSWRYDRVTKVLRATFRARAGRLTVRPC
jgi:hypothetical protein